MRGIARRAWDGYAARSRRSSTPALRPLARKYAAGSIVDLIGFWAVWHLEGGFEGLLRMGMSRASDLSADQAVPDRVRGAPGRVRDAGDHARCGRVPRLGLGGSEEGQGAVASLRLSVRAARHSLLSETSGRSRCGRCRSTRRRGRAAAVCRCARSALPSGGPPNAERAAEEAGRQGAGEDPPLRGREPAEPARHADLSRARAATTRCGCARIWRGSSASCATGSTAGRFPYVWVPQWHPGGHGLHAHFAVGRFVPRGLIERAWGHGFVHIKLLDGLPVGSGALAEARLAARYWRATSAASSRTSAGWPGCTATRSRRASSRRRSSATARRPRT